VPATQISAAWHVLATLPPDDTTPRRISLGNIGALHDGLGEFSLQIGQRVAAAAPLWREQFGIAFDFHLREKLFGLFGSEVGYLP